ncbi:hypothetical protein [Vibrio palustris]|uniref:Uncharacterized protein n=1 Tax=Vibrio palustris TaxID=1918946 RepID=A0A1R4B803_9VIBR|nr:hypothetical protein [Vibrio palustris]SJL85053.1 hypothetical protein VPAL9027_03074 [Vibrio palustris]
MTNDDTSRAAGYLITHQQWHLTVSDLEPTIFRVFYGNKPVFKGSLSILNNGESIALGNINWNFRHRSGRIEQWCQMNHEDKLSMNMNYYFEDGSLVVEYLARNSIPTRLDVRHDIESSEQSHSEQLNPESPTITHHWHRRRHGLPSEFLVNSSVTDFFREAFSATQWIVLEKV